VPGCPHCGLTYDEIRKLAEWITLKEQPACRFQIVPFDRAWHIAPRQRWSRNEIIVNIKILHSRNVDGPVDESQEQCLNKLRVELKKLGVREGVWQTAKADGALITKELREGSEAFFSSDAARECLSYHARVKRLQDVRP
jgi:hypothetical protein